MKFFVLLILFKITQCEYDRRVITTLKYSKYHTVPTIVNGNPASEGQMPYVASIKESATRKGDKILWLPLCGASIISDKKVLTAAHCFEARNFYYKNRPDLLRIVAGSLTSDIEHTGETETTNQAQWRKLSKVYLHKQYTFPENDIALVIVNVPWNFTETVNYASIATLNSDYPSSCFSAGFGLTSHKIMPRMTPVLLKAEIDVIPLWKCSAIWEIDMSSFICTDSAFSDVGLGDSGGPLGCRYTLDPAEEPGRDVLVGVVSGKNFDKTSLFTRVSRYKRWIDNPASSSGCKLFNGVFMHVITFLVSKYVVF